MPLLYHRDNDEYEAQCDLNDDCRITAHFFKGGLSASGAAFHLTYALRWAFIACDLDGARRQRLACPDCAAEHARQLRSRRFLTWWARNVTDKNVTDKIASQQARRHERKRLGLGEYRRQ
jgi:hypothetical protein